MRAILLHQHNLYGYHQDISHSNWNHGIVGTTNYQNIWKHIKFDCCCRDPDLLWRTSSHYVGLGCLLYIK